jgi:glutamine synthetase
MKTHSDQTALVSQCMQEIATQSIDQIRFAWCDIHGITRCKTLTPRALQSALEQGIGMVSTLLLKDTSDRTAYKVFESGGVDDLPGFGQGNNVVLKPDLSTFKQLPWSPKTAWIQCQAYFSDGHLVPFDSRSILERAIKHLSHLNMKMMCGLEIEFHIYKLKNPCANTDPSLAQWPSAPPEVELIHPGYNLLSEAWADMAHEPLRIVQDTAKGLNLPLMSLEVEFGPSQVEAVFDVTDAMTAADNMVLFRNSVRQALMRQGYYASFVCRPPFKQIMSSGWHLHQSLVDAKTHFNLFQRQESLAFVGAENAQHTLSELGEHYLAGLLAHARGTSIFCTPTINGYDRYAPNALAPQSLVWGRDNRGALLRVIGQCNDPSTRIENRQGEPAANPYLYMASQIYAGLDGIHRQLKAPLATDSPYQNDSAKLPSTMSEALDALEEDSYLSKSLGQDFIRYISTLKRSELNRYTAAVDKRHFNACEYFARI